MLNQPIQQNRQMQSAELGGFWSKFGEIAGNIGGSFIGNPKIGTAIFGGNSGGNNQAANQHQTILAQIRQAATDVNSGLDTLIAAVSGGQLNAQTGWQQRETLWNAWLSNIFNNTAMNQNQEQTQLIASFEPALEQKLGQLDAAIRNAPGANNTTTTGTNNSSQIIAGIDNTYLLIGGGIGLYLLAKR